MFLSIFTLCNLCFQIGYLRKETDGSLIYTVVNQLDPDAEGLLSVSVKHHLQPRVATCATVFFIIHYI